MSAVNRERAIAAARMMTDTPPEQLAAMLRELTGIDISGMLGWSAGTIRTLLELIEGPAQ